MERWSSYNQFDGKTTFTNFYYTITPLRGHCAYTWFAHVMNSTWKMLGPMSECYLMPQATCWAAGSRSAAAWQVTDIKELRDPKVVVRQWSDTFFYEAFVRYFCDIASKQVCLGLSCLCECVWSCEAAWLVGGLIGKTLHAWVRSNLPPSVDTQQ